MAFRPSETRTGGRSNPRWYAPNTRPAPTAQRPVVAITDIRSQWRVLFESRFRNLGVLDSRHCRDSEVTCVGSLCRLADREPTGHDRFIGNNRPTATRDPESERVANKHSLLIGWVSQNKKLGYVSYRSRFSIAVVARALIYNTSLSSRIDSIPTVWYFVSPPGPGNRDFEYRTSPRPTTTGPRTLITPGPLRSHHKGKGMIVCTQCETAYCLQITESAIRFESGSVTQIDEKYHCTECDVEGRYWYLEGEECVNGRVEIVDERPRMKPA